MSAYTHYSMNKGMPFETHGRESGMLSALKSVAHKAKQTGQEIASRLFAPSETDMQIARILERGHEIIDRKIDEAFVEGGTYDKAFDRAYDKAYDKAFNAYIVKDICAHIDSNAIADKVIHDAFGLHRPLNGKIVGTSCPAATAQPK